ncbi:hypothetical protein SK128_015199 [Halocaridina rubra]|uniref:CID domain-containing protein n=1 Tax=Halocaridina rubra TaxID=373956 RepID=A0AAN9AC96_HALRR
MTAKEVADEYSSSLSDLSMNSKPLITMLTMLAEENLAHASVIVKVIEKHIHSAPNKLPLMYLIDSILKNVGKDYTKLFAQNIISIFTFVFEKVDERTRKKLYELRHTWNEIFPKSKLYMLDTKVHLVDPAWPVAATGSSITPATTKPNIHINPNVIIKSGAVKSQGHPPVPGEKELKDLKDLEILKQEQKILELKKQRLLWEQKKNNLEQNRQQQKSEAESSKADPSKPVSKPAEDPTYSAERRAEFLRSFKIKKKVPSQEKEDKKVSSTIHVDPRRAHIVLPQVAASVPSTSRDPRTESSRDSRAEQTSRDPRIKPETSSRDPRLSADNSRDPRLAQELTSCDPRLSVEASPNLGSPSLISAASPVPKTVGNSVHKTSVGSAHKTPEVRLPSSTSTRDPRVSNKNAESKSDNSPKSTKKDSFSKSKKGQKSEKTEKSEKNRKSEKSDTRSKNSTSRDKEKEALLKSAKALPVVESPTFNKSKKSKGRSYMHREESPEEKDSSMSSSGKRSRSDRSAGSDDSQDSDHYVGNIPNRPSQRISSKKAKKHDTSRSQVISDMDYRHFPPSKRHSEPTDENVSPQPKKDKIMDEMKKESPQNLGLFSDKDVDYRQLLPRPLHVVPPSPAIPPAVRASFSTEDQDERKCGTQDMDIDDDDDEEGDMAPPLTPLRGADNRFRKPSFNSPHAASWEKFREKNPEFKEYTRQASISESDRNFSPEGDDIEFKDNDQHGFPIRIRDMNIPGPLERHKIPGRLRGIDDEEGSESPRSAETAHENYKVILSQAEEYMKHGEMNITQYNHLLTQVMMLVERNKIQQVRDRDRQMSRTPQPGSDNVRVVDPSPSMQPPGGPGRPGPGAHLVGDHPLNITGSPGGPHGGTFTRHHGGPHSRSPGGPSTGPLGGHSPGHMSGPGSPGGMGRGSPNFDGGGRGGRGGFMRGGGGEGPMSRRGGMIGHNHMGRGMPTPTPDEDGWGRGIRGRGRRGLGGFGRDRDGRLGRGQRSEQLEDEWTGEPELPGLSDEYLQVVDRDNITRKIEIDGSKREVRTYGETAVIFMNWDDPRLLSFGEGQVDIVFDGGVFRLAMRIGEPYREFTFEGKTHRIKLGPPSQELVLDDVGHHCLIGGDPITVHFDGASHTIALVGKIPNVNINPVRNTEFVAGFIKLVIQATKFVTLYLDARPQRFSIDGRAFVIKFVDSLKAVTINNKKYVVDFGGLPITIPVRGYRRYLSFSDLPRGIIPGQISIRNMEGESSVMHRGPDSGMHGPPGRPPKDMSPPLAPTGPKVQAPLPPVSGPPQVRPSLPGPPHPPGLKGPLPGFGGPHAGPLGPAGPVSLPGPRPSAPISLPGPRPSAPVPLPGPRPPAPPIQGPPQPPVLPSVSQPQGLPIVSTSSVPPPMPGPVPIMAGPRPVFPFMHHPPPPIMPHVGHGSYVSNQAPAPPFVTPPAQPAMPMDINSLLINLTRSGLIGSKAKNKEEEKKLEEEEEEKEREADDRIPVELLLRTENLRKRRKWLIETIYRGMQCSSCGLRYPPEQTVQYSHHLDWHFRKNKKQQESTKKANTRKFYFSVEDWLQYEEIEDLEERVPSMFEAEGAEDMLEAEDSEVPSVPVTSDSSLEVCPTCLDKFEQFFHQDTEEWRYLNAVQVDGQNYHPACHLDNLRAEEALKKEAEKEAKAATTGEEEKMETEPKETDEEKEKGDEKEKESEMETDDKENDNKTKKTEPEGGVDMDADTQKMSDEEKVDDPVESQLQKIPNEEKADAHMESQLSVTTKLDDMSINSQLSIRIKEEPMDVEEDADLLTYSPSLPPGVTIKQEIKKEPEEQDEGDLTFRVPEEDDESSLLNVEMM